MKSNLTYKEDIIIFGKVVCTWCGSQKDLMHIEVSKIRVNKVPEIHDTVICKECFNELPDHDGLDKGYADNNINNDERDY